MLRCWFKVPQRSARVKRRAALARPGAQARSGPAARVPSSGLKAGVPCGGVLWLTRHGLLTLGASIALVVLCGCGPRRESSAPMRATPTVPARLTTPSTPAQERPTPAQEGTLTLSTATTTPPPAMPSTPVPAAAATPTPTTSPLPRPTMTSIPALTATPLPAPTITPTPMPTPMPTATATPLPVPTLGPPPATLLPTATVNPAYATAEAAITPRATLAPHYPSYEVGAYYFSGWSHGPNDNLNPLLMGRYQISEPLIGWYDDTQTAVDQSIAQAADAGIDLFAFDWYAIARAP